MSDVDQIVFTAQHCTSTVYAVSKWTIYRHIVSVESMVCEVWYVFNWWWHCEC